VITRLPSSLKCETAACAFADYIYVVGLGNAGDEIWRYRLSSCVLRAGKTHDAGPTEWTLCARLVTGRRRHCTVVVGRQLYVIAGIASSDDSAVLDSIEVSNLPANSVRSPGTSILRGLGQQSRTFLKVGV